jgi:23S rRNA (cytidine1920-2'-O)/16S rRNA (cytidine1409-2'-O)-methyltransferase
VKVRLDQLLVDRGLAESRARAQALIRAGDVTVSGQVLDKPGTPVAADAELSLRPAPAYVGRGALKLAAALDAWGIDPAGRIALDVGASTGGFTDLLLQRGATRVYAVDVGRGQLAWRLRQDPRVDCLERTDIRALAPRDPPASLATVDVSFISLGLVLPAVVPHLHREADVIALVKPQFEAGKGQVGRGGVLRDPAQRLAVVAGFLDWAAAADWRALAAIPAPIRGASGNQEYLVHLALPGSGRAGQPSAGLQAALAAAEAGAPDPPER